MPDEPRCNCNDEFRTKPCPIHDIPEEVDGSSYGQEIVLITDEDLAPEVYGSYTGFKFTCPNCGNPSIMVNNDMGDFCTCCGQKVLVKPKTVTEYLNRKR